MWTLSAPDRDGLRRNIRAQAVHLARRDEADLAALCYTSNKIKASLPHRFAVPADSLGGLLETMRAAVRDPATLDALTGGGHPRVRYGLVLPGIDAWPTGAPIGVSEAPGGFLDYLNEATTEFRVVEDCLDLYDDRVEDAGGVRGAALFCVEYALGRALYALDLNPAFLAGNGVGAAAAACLTGALTLNDASARFVGLPRLDPERAPRVPLLSAADGTGTGRWLTPDGPRTAPPEDVGHLVRVGPSGRFARRVEDAMRAHGPPARVVTVAADAGRDLLALVAALFREGFEVKWEAAYSREHRTLRGLAPYAFARTGHPHERGTT
ncbi:hypothetical protein BJF79_42855 [Actinomadura sp. CNU-125]|nr:hypothetical protein BJF79_42855 [Actinomadura sp. CNU-125]